MAHLLMMETNWETGQTVNCEMFEEVDNLTQAKNIIEADFAKSASEEFTRIVIDLLDGGANHIHVRNGHSESGLRILFVKR